MRRALRLERGIAELWRILHHFTTFFDPGNDGRNHLAFCLIVCFEFTGLSRSLLFTQLALASLDDSDRCLFFFGSHNENRFASLIEE